MNNTAEYARKAWVQVSIAGHDVTAHLAGYVKSFTYTDNASGKADEVQLTLHNRDGLFTDGKLKKGLPVKATIMCRDWEESGTTLSLPCGSFEIDELELSGPPDSYSIRAVSAALTTSLRDTAKTRAWEGANLETVAADIAKENGLQLMYDGDSQPLGRIDQRAESDLSFMARAARARGMMCKVHDGKLAVFDAEKAERAATSLTMARTGGLYSPKSYSFRTSSGGTAYTSAEVDYTDPATGTTHSATAAAVDVDPAAPEKPLTYHQRAESAGEAMKAAQAQLHNANASETTATVECLGCPLLVAGITVQLTGYGIFDGRYFVKTATHKLGSSGYTTSAQMVKGAQTRPVQARDKGARHGSL